MTSNTTSKTIALPASFRYLIETDGHRFGRLRSVQPRLSPAIGKAEHCYRLFFGRSDPCDGCPARSRKQRRDHVAVIRPNGPGPMHLISADHLAGGRARMTAMAVTEATMSVLLRAKIDRLSDGAGLSSRERDVLDLVILGRSAAEMAGVLGITPRTVKFHTANLLRKLGADSRSDLLRLVL